MLVVLDTNQVFDDPLLTRPTLEALLRHRRDGQFSVAVPAVVVAEAADQYAKHLTKRPARGPEELGVPGETDAPPLGDPEWLERYRRRFDERLVELNIDVLDEPSMDEVEQWRAAGRKPFKNDGVMKDADARIWATCLEEASQGPVILISRNRKDFGCDASTFAPELRQDIERHGFEESRVLLRPTIVGALGDLGAPHVARAEAKDRLERGKGKMRLKKAAEGAARGLLDDESAARLPFLVDLDPETVHFDSFDVKRSEVTAAFRIGEDIAVEASVFGEALLDVLVFRADAYGLPDDSPIRIHDYEYNETYAEGQAYVDLEVLIEAAVSPIREVSTVEFIGARPVPDA